MSEEWPFDSPRYGKSKNDGKFKSTSVGQYMAWEKCPQCGLGTPTHMKDCPDQIEIWKEGLREWLTAIAEAYENRAWILYEKPLPDYEAITWSGSSSK